MQDPIFHLPDFLKLLILAYIAPPESGLKSILGLCLPPIFSLS